MAARNPRARAAALAGLALAVAGAVVKTAGGLLHGSRALLVDGVTSVASIASGALLVYWLGRASLPPDSDHHYGHERLAYGAVAYTLALYSFAAGVGFAVLAHAAPYEVDAGAAAYAAAGLAFYAGAVVAYRLAGPQGASVAAFTSSEILESIVSMAAAAGGATLGYLVDYTGAWLIEAFIVYEAAKQAGGLVSSLSDRVDAEAVAAARRELESRGFTISRLRLRRVVPGKYHGDAVVAPPPGMPPDVADLLADEASSALESRGIDLTIHVDVARTRGGRDRVPR